MKDRFNREITYLRLSVTELCNLRCRYCMPEEGICKKQHIEMLTEEEMVRVVKAASNLGITKVRITGGEPLVKKNILSICERISKINGIEEICMTTNGILLPDMAQQLKDAGVKRLNISLDTLDEKKYYYITRIGQLEDAKRGIQKATEVGFEKIKINCVLIGGYNDDEIVAFAKLTENQNIDVRFIELMPMVECPELGQESFISNQVVLSKIPELVPVSNGNGVARMYQLPGAVGKIGLISPVTDAFCGQCNRIRVTADGMIKPCLHSKTEISLKGLSVEEMMEAFTKAVSEKPENHEDLTFGHFSDAKRSMNQIGG